MKYSLRNGFAVIVVALVFALVGCETGASPVESKTYREDQDVYIVFRGQHIADVTSLLPGDLVSDLLFELQEGSHDTITDVSGAELDHYYIWLCLEELCIPVDPFSFNY